MANVKFFGPVDMYHIPAVAGELVDYDATHVVLGDDTNYAVFHGTGFTYSQSKVTGGTLTSVDIYLSKALYTSVTGLNMPATTATALVLTENSQKVFQAFLKGADSLTGSSSHDVIAGYNGNDTVSGAGGGDSLLGLDGADVLKGGNGADTLYGGNGNDRLNGGFGNDTISGGAGKDVLDGAAGADRFFFNSAGESGPFAYQSDTILHFEHGVDKINLSKIGELSFGGSGEGTVHAIQSGDDTVILVNSAATAGYEMKIILADFTASTLTGTDFFL